MTFTCEACGLTFESARTKEEADREYIETFGSGTRAIVCDDCYRLIMKAAKA